MTFDPFTTPAPRETARAKNESEVRRDGYGRYLLPSTSPEADPNKEIPWTRATTFAKSISDTFALSQWSQRMVAKGLSTRPDLYALACATPVEDRDTLNKLCEDAKDAAAARARAHLGTALHAFTEARDRGEDVEIPEPWNLDVQAYSTLVAAHGLEFPWIERIVAVPRFKVAGTFDRIGRATRDIDLGHTVIRAGEYVIVDLKTGRDLSYGWNEISIQLFLYSVAEGIWDPESWAYEPMPEGLRRDVALVIHLPVGEAKATLWSVDLEPAARAAELCYEVREWRKTRRLASQVGVAETVGTTTVAAGTAPTRKAEAAPAEARKPRRACSKCRQPGHTARNCPGPQEAVQDVQEVAQDTEWCVCTSRTSGWTAPPEGSPEGTPWVCGACGKQSRAGMLTGRGVPVEHDRLAPVQAPAEVRPPTWAERIDAATSKGELSAIRKEAMAAGEWSYDLTQRGLSRMKSFTEPAG